MMVIRRALANAALVVVHRLELRAAGDRLEGVVTRRTGLGPRANLVVTLWAELERER